MNNRPTDSLAGASRAELSRLIAAHAEARSGGRAAVIVLHAMHGGGIDEILKEWRRHLMQAREPVFEGLSRPDGATYRPLRELVGRHLRSLEDLGLLDEEGQRLADAVSPSLGIAGAVALTRTGPADGATQLPFFEGMGQLIRYLMVRLPAIWVVHDFDRADSATRAALLWLLANTFSDPLARWAAAPSGTPSAGVLVLTTAERDGALDALRRDLVARDDVHWISLHEWEEERVRRFLQSDAVVERLVRLSGGSLPRLQELVDDLPARAEELHLRRVALLAAEEQAVLEALAVLGRPVKPDFLLRVAAIEPAPSLAVLAERGFLSRQVHRGELLVDFADVEHRERLYAQIPADRRRRLHGRVAALLEERSRLGEPVDLETIAHHFLHGEDDPRAVAYALDAADRLQISFAWQRAVEVLETLRGRVTDAALRTDVEDRLANLYAWLHDTARALTLLDALRNDASPARRIDANRRRSSLFVEAGDYTSALESLALAQADLSAHGAALAQDDALDVADARAMLDVVEAEARYGLGDYDAATEIAQAGLVRLGDGRRASVEALGLANTLGKVALFRGQYDEATKRFSDNRRLARTAGLGREEVRALVNLGTIALQQRQYEDAERMFRQCLAVGVDANNPVIRAFLHLNLGVIAHRTLRYGEAMQAYLSALAAFHASGNELQFAVAALNLGSLYETLGDLPRARRLLEESLETTTRRDIKYFRGRAWFTLGTLELGAGRSDAAVRALERARALLGQTGSTFDDRILVALARAAHLRGDAAARDAWMGALRGNQEAADADEAGADAMLYRGFFALQDGDHEVAVDCLIAGLEACERQGLHERAWLGRVWLATVWQQQGDGSRALAMARSAVDLIDHLAQQVPDPLRETYLQAPDRMRAREAVRAIEAGRAPTWNEAPEALEDPRTEPGFLAWRSKYATIVGEDPRLLQILRLISRVADADSSVLIQGESGTGKELVAEAIHRESARAAGPFIKVNCAAFVETLLLSELFGHERGAFTGATARRKGRFELAHGGTLFLDEIGDISPNTQVALLRVLQERTFERVGGTETVEADVRLICATNRNLEEMVRAGTFRLDLYYRLKGIVLELPPLRDRRSDIPLLIQHFFTLFSRDVGHRRALSPDAMARLVRYSWPGNIREMENFVRSLLLLVDGDRIELADVRQFDDFFADGEFLPEAPRAPYAPPRTTGALPAVPTLPARAVRTKPTIDDVPVVRAEASQFPPIPTAGEGGTQMAGAPGLGAGTNLEDDSLPVVAAPAAAPASAPAPVFEAAPASEAGGGGGGGAENFAAWAVQTGIGLHDMKRQIEVEMVRFALVQSDGNITRAARLLDMRRPRLSQIVNGSPELEALRGRLSGRDDGEDDLFEDAE